MRGLNGRVAMVVGGAHGIGRATAAWLGDAGAFVAVADLDEDAAAVTTGPCRRPGVPTMAVQCDLTDSTSVDAAVSAVVEQWGRLDVLVNAAGGDREHPGFAATSDDTWRMLVDLNLTESGVRLVLNRLAEQGLVDATRAGQATLYAANRDHLAWPAVERLARLRQELLDRLEGLAASWTVKPVAVFGSAARGDGDASSDIDNLVIRPDPEHEAWEAQIDDLRDRVTAWSGNTCQVYDLTESEYRQHVQSGEPIVQEWRNEAVVVFGTPLAKIGTAGAA